MNKYKDEINTNIKNIQFYIRNNELDKNNELLKLFMYYKSINVLDNDGNLTDEGEHRILITNN